MSSSSLSRCFDSVYHTPYRRSRLTNNGCLSAASHHLDNNKTTSVQIIFYDGCARLPLLHLRSESPASHKLTANFQPVARCLLVNIRRHHALTTSRTSPPVACAGKLGKRGTFKNRRVALVNAAPCTVPLDHQETAGNSILKEADSAWLSTILHLLNSQLLG